MDKRALILDALQELLREGNAGTASVMDIAKKAGIAKGGMYYYFKSKEEALDALAYRQYAQVIEACGNALKNAQGSAIDKLKLLLYTYRNTAVDASVDEFLHQTHNAAIHQKSMADIVCGLSPLVAGIFRQGAEEKTFVCGHPDEFAEILVSVLTFLLDPGLFQWTDAQRAGKLKALAEFMEKGLGAQRGSFSFLYLNWTEQKLTYDTTEIEHGGDGL